MKTLILIFIFYFSYTLAKSQDEHIFLSPDIPPNCSQMKEGKFLNINYHKRDFYMIIENGIQTEYSENGKYYVRSKVTWISDCKYKLTFIENVSPNNSIIIGDSLFVEIIETQNEHIKFIAYNSSNRIESVFIKSQKSFDENQKNTDNPEDIVGKSEYNNAIDGKTYKTDGIFKKYGEGRKDSIPTTGLTKVILLNSNQENEKSLDIDELSKFIEKTKKIFQNNFFDSKKSGEIMVQFNLYKKKKTEIQFAVKDDIDLDKMAQFEIDINNEIFMKSKKHNITFQLIFRVNCIE